MTCFSCFRVPNFWVWAHRRLYPQGELLIQQAQRVIACSQELTQRGVLPGMTVAAAEALAQSSGALSLSCDPNCGELAWEELVEAIYRCTPFLLPQPLQLCWASLDLQQAQQLADQLGLAVGMASDRATAQLAAVAAEATQVRAVAAGGELDFADGLSLPVLLQGGVAWGSVQRLHWFGFSRVGELRRLTEKQLRQRFVDGDLIYQLSRPGSRQPLGPWSPPEERVGEALCEGTPLDGLLALAVQRALENLGDLLASRLTLELEVAGGVQRRGRWLKQPTSQAGKIALALQPLWEGLRQSQEPELIRVRLAGLRTPQRKQGSLWLIRPPMSVALQQLQQRFPGMVKKVAWHPGAEGVSEESWSFA